MSFYDFGKMGIMRYVNFQQMVVTLFDPLSAQLQNDKKPQNHRDWFLANCGLVGKFKSTWIYIDDILVFAGKFFLWKICQLASHNGWLAAKKICNSSCSRIAHLAFSSAVSTAKTTKVKFNVYGCFFNYLSYHI